MTALPALLGTTARAFLCALHVFLRICVLIVDTPCWAFIQPFRRRGLRLRAAVEQLVEIGVRSLPIAGLAQLAARIAAAAPL